MYIIYAALVAKRNGALTINQAVAVNFYHGSCSPRVSIVVKSSMHSLRATVAFFFWGWSMLSCFS